MKWLAFVLVVSMPVLADIAAPPPPAPAPAPTEAVVPAPAVAAPAPAAAEHPGGNDKAPAAPRGVIEGGWAYVYAAWGAGVFGLVAYAASLFLRRSSEAPPPGAP